MPLIEIGRYNGALEVDMDIWSHLDDIVELDMYDLFPFKEAQLLNTGGFFNYEKKKSLTTKCTGTTIKNICRLNNDKYVFHAIGITSMLLLGIQVSPWGCFRLSANFDQCFWIQSFTCSRGNSHGTRVKQSAWTLQRAPPDSPGHDKKHPELSRCQTKW